MSDLGLVPPHSLEAEMSVLGAILQSNEALLKCLELLQPAHFYRESHRKIFAAAKKLFQRSELVDLITVTNDLRGRGELEEVGTAVFLASLVEAVPTAANVRHHAEIVLKTSRLRDLAACASDLIHSSLSQNGWQEGWAAVVSAGEALMAGSQQHREDLTVGIDTFIGPAPPMNWDIAGVRVRGDHGWTGGAPKSMKGLLSLEEARAQSTGTPFLGHFATRKARVLYVSEEDRIERLHRRLNAMLAGRPADEIPGLDDLRFLIKTGVRLDTPGGLRILRDHLGRWEPEIAFLEHFDKLHSKNPNAPDEMKPILDTLDQLHQEFGCVFRIQKHHRKEGGGQSKRKGEMLSGTQALFGWGESSVSLTLLRRGVAQVDCEAKDGDVANRFLIEYRDGRIEYAGEVRGDRQEQKKELVIKFLTEHPHSTTAQVAEALKRTERTARQLLGTMESDGLVVGNQETSGHVKLWRFKFVE